MAYYCWYFVFKAHKKNRFQWQETVFFIEN